MRSGASVSYRCRNAGEVCPMPTEKYDDYDALAETSSSRAFGVDGKRSVDGALEVQSALRAAVFRQDAALARSLRCGGFPRRLSPSGIAPHRQSRPAAGSPCRACRTCRCRPVVGDDRGPARRGLKQAHRRRVARHHHVTARDIQGEARRGVERRVLARIEMIAMRRTFFGHATLPDIAGRQPRTSCRRVAEPAHTTARQSSAGGRERRFPCSSGRRQSSCARPYGDTPAGSTEQYSGTARGAWKRASSSRSIGPPVKLK